MTCSWSKDVLVLENPKNGYEHGLRRVASQEHDHEHDLFEGELTMGGDHVSR
jgi:hypothetical protein